MADFDEFFGPGGALAIRLPEFSYREAQHEMAQWIGAALDAGEHLVVEAGTGIGKTFAYLLPVLVSGQQVVISTATRTLQDQLYARDLPLLGAIVGRPVKVVELKGRGNYLCRHRLAIARGEGSREASEQATLDALASWCRVSESGDLTELEDFAADHPLRSALTSTTDNCLGARCEHYEQCFLVAARRRAQSADVVIVNHHLLLSDLALKETGFGELLPAPDAVIVDEAHQLPEIAQQFFGTAVSSRELERLARDTLAEAEAAGRRAELAAAAIGLADAARAASGPTAERNRLPWRAAPRALQAAAHEWRAALEALAARLGPLGEASAGLARCLERCDEQAAKLARLESAGEEAELVWFETAPQRLALNWTPIDAGERLGARIAESAAAWIFTSATLAVGDDFSHFRARIGLPEIDARRLQSPFDYASNARLYLPQGLPLPDDEDYLDGLLMTVMPLLEATRGGAFLLFTSYRALKRAERWLAAREFSGPLLVQGNAPRTLLLDQFRASGEAVLLGTASFWQGVDVRGPALRLVVIDRLPFSSPGDPLTQARIESIRRLGGDPFREFQLPQAVLALKQGVGRLIRDFGDRGLVVLGDPRLSRRAYGRVFLESLPPMPRIDTPEEAIAFLAELAPAAARSATS